MEVKMKDKVNGLPEVVIPKGYRLDEMLDFEGDLYGQTIEVELLEFLREERRFGSTEELSHQIEADKKRARERLRRDSDL